MVTLAFVISLVVVGLSWIGAEMARTGGRPASFFAVFLAGGVALATGSAIPAVWKRVPTGPDGGRRQVLLAGWGLGLGLLLWAAAPLVHTAAGHGWHEPTGPYRSAPLWLIAATLWALFLGYVLLCGWIALRGRRARRGSAPRDPREPAR